MCVDADSANRCLPQIKTDELCLSGVEKSDLPLSIISLIQHNKLLRDCFILWASSNVCRRISITCYHAHALAPVFESEVR